MRLGALMAGLLMAVVGAAPVLAQPSPTSTPKPGGAPGIGAAAAVLVDLTDDEVLFGRAVHAPRAPASLTKVVTALVVRDEYDLDDIVTVTDKIYTARGSSLGLRPGMRYTVRDLLYALLLKSANDAAVALADHHPLGYDYFIRLMNQKARALGAYGSSFHNPHGLDQPGHVSTAWDLAIFARQLLADPVLAEVVATKRYEMTWNDGTKRILTNHNKLLFRRDDVVGVKTGFTNIAGHSLISAARTPNGPLLAVVLGAKDPGAYLDSGALLDFGKVELTRTSAGGGGPERPTLPAPPTAPVLAGLETLSDAIEGDLRDRPWWGSMMAGFAAAAAATLVRRPRRDPLRVAADHHAWLDAVVEPVQRRRF